MYRDLIEELRGFAEGSTSARASLMRDAAAALEALSSPPADDVRKVVFDLLGGHNHAHSAALNASCSCGWAGDGRDYGGYQMDGHLADVIAAEVRLRGTVTDPTEAEVDAAAQSLASLSDDEWAEVRGQDHVRYYVVSARQALEAARVAAAREAGS